MSQEDMSKKEYINLAKIDAAFYALGEAFQNAPNDFLTEFDIHHFLCDRLGGLFLSRVPLQLWKPVENDEGALKKKGIDKTCKIQLNIRIESGQTSKGIDIVILDDRPDDKPYDVGLWKAKENDKISYFIDTKFLAGIEVKRIDSGKSFKKSITKDIKKFKDYTPLNRYIVIVDFRFGNHKEDIKKIIKDAEDKGIELFYAGRMDYGIADHSKDGGIVLK